MVERKRRESAVLQDDNRTKWRIFETAAALFSENGYERVSMREIARAVGIQAGSIYNHFGSKEALLQEMYDFYLRHVATHMSNPQQMLALAEQGQASEVLSRIIMHYEPPYAECLSQIIKIAISRAHLDENAKVLVNAVFYDHLDKVLRPVLNRLIELGKAKPVNVDIVIEMYRSLCLSASLRVGTWYEVDEQHWQALIRALLRFVAEKTEEA